MVVFMNVRKHNRKKKKKYAKPVCQVSVSFKSCFTDLTENGCFHKMSEDGPTLPQAQPLASGSQTTELALVLCGGDPDMTSLLSSGRAQAFPQGPSCCPLPSLACGTGVPTLRSCSLS